MHDFRRVSRLSLSMIAASLSAACSPLYVVRAGIEEAKILSRRQPISDVVANPDTDAGTRHKLELVLQARDFAEHALALDAGKSYTTYSWVDSDTLLLVVSAAHKDRFEPHTWWFPIVGRVPYKGFFDFDAARATAAKLRDRGLDAYVRPSAAFSTLGWFNDPVLNTVLRSSDVSLVSTVIHELLHNTIFVGSHVSFNESFANFVGDRGAIEFFCAREGEDSDRCRRARAAWHDNLLFGEFLTGLVAELETLYRRSDLSSEEKIAQREPIFDAARKRFAEHVEPRLETMAFRGFSERQLDNATLIGIRLYYDRLNLFEAAFQRHGGDLPATIAAITQSAENDGDPFHALERLAS